jgi:hypothetical protein
MLLAYEGKTTVRMDISCSHFMTEHSQHFFICLQCATGVKQLSPAAEFRVLDGCQGNVRFLV